MSMTNNLEIILVDDDNGHRNLVSRNLRRAGVSNSIREFTTGDIALDYIFCRGEHASRPGSGHLLILLDLNMPGLDGLEVLKQIKGDPKKCKIPVIMLTTTDDPREIERCYAAGCGSYIVKPVATAAFLDAINKLGLYISIISLPSESGR
jgi:CheY-like chemotaxis protein